eukprot:4390121-Karenia_brevis.AAC.1
MLEHVLNHDHLANGICAGGARRGGLRPRSPLVWVMWMWAWCVPTDRGRRTPELAAGFLSNACQAVVEAGLAALLVLLPELTGEEQGKLMLDWNAAVDSILVGLN